MHIDYLNLASNNESITLELKDNSNKGESTFTLLIGENGVHKTTLLTYIYKLFSNRPLDKNIRMKIQYTINNKKHGISTYLGTEKGHNVIVDSFSRIDKMDKSYLDLNNNRIKVNDALIREFINQMVITSIDDYKKYQEIRNLFDYIGVNSNDLILSYRTRSRKSDSTYLTYLSNDKFVLELNKLFKYLESDQIFQQVYSEEKSRLKHIFDKEDSYKREFLIKIKAIEQFVPTLFSDLNHNSLYKRDYAFIFLHSFVDKVFEKETFKKIFVFFKEWLRSDFFNNLYIGNEKFPLIALSTGEISLLLRLFNIINKIESDSIVLIDEPELHLHPNWCINYISTLKKLFNKYNSHFFIATHSPLLVANLNKENIVVLKKINNHIESSHINTGTFSVNVDTVLEQVFEVTIRDSEIISNFYRNIENKIESDNREKQLEGIQQLKALSQSSEKFRVFKKYYDKIKELENDL